MTTEKANKVYDILVLIGGASEHERDSFIHHHVYSKYPCDEWRFGGKLGFGGKYRSRNNRVDCYKEDDTPKRSILIQQINEELSKIKEV